MSEPYLRKANAEDIDLLFHWANDVRTRENAFNTQEISYTEHQKWFYEKVASNDSTIYIYCQGDTPIGQARIDVDGVRGLISYSIGNAHRLRGHGGMLISLLEDAVVTDFPLVKDLVARVKKTNIASQRIFEQHIYGKKEFDAYIEYTKTITSNTPPPHVHPAH